MKVLDQQACKQVQVETLVAILFILKKPGVITKEDAIELIEEAIKTISEEES